MKDLNLLIVSLNEITKNGLSEDAFNKTISEISKFYVENLNLNEDEVAILLTDKDKEVLSFAAPQYLVNSGLIPINSSDAFASIVYRLNKQAIDNNFNQQKHLNLFEFIKTPENKIKHIWKMLATTITAENDKLGVIELSRKGETIIEAGEDFTQNDLDFVVNSIEKLAPFIKKVMPENFRGKLT